MKKMEYQNVKGTKDYLPEEERVRRRVRRTLEDVFIRYGCKPLETPVLNYTDLMASKYAGGSEILKEMYTLTDRGNRDLALRYDLTIPFAKVIAMNPTLKMPFKRYEIGKVFRDGPIKTGRYREFTQCDVDIVGVENQMAEAELMDMAVNAFNELDLDITIHYNNRKILVGMLEEFNVPGYKVNDVVLVLDKLEKMGLEIVMNELEDTGIPDFSLANIRDFLNNVEMDDIDYFLSINNTNKNIEEGLKELRSLQTYLSYLEVKQNCVFNPFLARGLDIYTGTIYEIFSTDKNITSSIGSGGRYDNAIGGLIGTDEEFSTVGISFGLDVVSEALINTGNNLAQSSDVDIYIIPINTPKESLKLASCLRNEGYKVEVEMGDKKVGKAIAKANKEHIATVIIVGEQEVKEGVYKVKDMKTGEERTEKFSYT